MSFFNALRIVILLPYIWIEFSKLAIMSVATLIYSIKLNEGRIAVSCHDPQKLKTLLSFFRNNQKGHRHNYRSISKYYSMGHLFEQRIIGGGLIGRAWNSHEGLGWRDGFWGRGWKF